MDSEADGKKLTEEERKESIAQALASWREAAKRSDETRLTFHNQLAVLSAGSIAVIASGTVAMLSWSATHTQKATHQFYLAVIIASAALWIALFCCVLHNYLETILQERESASNRWQTFIKLVEFYRERYGTDADGKFSRSHEEKSDKRANLTLRLERAQLWVSSMAVLFFMGGYSALIYLIWTEAKLL